VHRSGEHLLRLIDDLLDLSRIEAGQLELEPAPCELEGLLDEVVALEAPLAQERGLRLERALDPLLPIAAVLDSTRVRQVLLNLVSNAIKFTEHGRVTIGFARDARHLVVQVTDTGPGLSEAAVSKLFARFGQGARLPGGSGLGLAISKRLVELMHGSLDVDSRPGRGTTMRVALPLSPCEIPVRTEPVRPRRAAACLELLVVDDDAATREMLGSWLSEAGHRVSLGANGLDALRLLDERRYDVALLDLDLPGVDGFELARLARRRGAARLALVAISARSDAGVEVLCREAGFDAFVRKPLTGAMLDTALAPYAAREPADAAC